MKTQVVLAFIALAGFLALASLGRTFAFSVAAPIAIALIVLLFYAKKSDWILLLVIASVLAFPEQVGVYLGGVLGHPLGDLYLTDILIIMLFSLWAFRSIVTGRLRLSRNPVNLPLSLWLIMCALALVNALSRGTAFNYSFNEFRVMMYYTFFFWVANSMTSRRLIECLVRILPVLAVGVALHMMYLYSQMGTNLRFLSVNGAEYKFAQCAFILMFGLYVLSSCERKIVLPALLLSGMAVLFYFTRTQWATSILAIFIILVLGYNSGRLKRTSVTFFVVGASVLFLTYIMTFLFPGYGDFIGSVKERFLSTTPSTATAQFRIQESIIALEYAMKSPVIGHGFAVGYTFIERGEGSEAYRLVHNSYVWILLRMGFAGLVVFLWLILAFLKENMAVIRKTRNDAFLNALSIGVFAVFVSTIVNSLTIYDLTSGRYIIVISTLMGLITATEKVVEKEKS